MAAKAAKSKAPKSAAGKSRVRRPPRRKKAEPKSKGLPPEQVAQPTPEGESLAAQIEADGGKALAIYREPLGGHPVVFAALPLDKVAPTPYQRDVSEAHVKKLASAMERVDYFLDPVIAVRKDGMYWSPNGNHRLNATKLLGGQSLLALVLADEGVAYQILALNTEKAHNLKERSTEVVRMLRGMVGAGDTRTEAEVAPLFEEASFATLGAVYEQRPRYSGGAYHPVLKKCEGFLEVGLEEALRIHEAHAAKLIKLDDAVVKVVDGLKARGLTSPYLKNFVVARLNFLRFKKGTDLSDFDETIDKMTASAERFDVSGVKKEDLAKMGGGGGGGGDEE